MKRIILFLTVCLGLSVSQTTFADNTETARAAIKRTPVAKTSSSQTTSNRSVASGTRKTETQKTKNTRTATSITPRTATRTPTTQQSVKQRNATTTTSLNNVATRISTTARNATTTRTIEQRQKTSNTPARSAVARSGVNRSVRIAELNNDKITTIKSKDYSKCKSVYYECMDEFCANKDTNLRRCACSARSTEFNDIKKQLSDAEDQMTRFNQRLLTVNLDKEDAAAISQATEGELAFEKTDTSESEKLLQKITKTLNSSGDSKITNDLSAISLSLDMESAWDDVDAFSGISTSAKTGIALYNAAQPICLEMAQEVCNDDELNIVQDGYKLTIEQDCNTVSKSYNTLYNQAMDKIHESSALLDISRLNIHQQRNSDDTLTCRKKILEQLSDASVCGEDLYKCIDITGQYINPSTGAAVLSPDLYKLSTLLQSPTNDTKWSKVTQNENFVNFLNSKKTFLEPAIANCKDISDMIWSDFIEDALAEIKLAQTNKIEEIRQSCTTLISECKKEAQTSLAEFDSRALSTFSVSADKAINTMCADVQNACINLISNTSDSSWDEGITNITTDISYETVVDTCTNIGRNCIIRQCSGTLGNFALCQDPVSDARLKILNRTACWKEVYDCVSKADNLDNMKISDTDTYYHNNYNTTDVIKYDCKNDTKPTVCLITEQIWGNCSNNEILTPNTDSTLLSWFAANTIKSCQISQCKEGFVYNNTRCVPASSIATDDCKTAQASHEYINVTSSLTNFCETGSKDKFGNCCLDAVSNNICVPSNPNHQYKAVLFQKSASCTQKEATTDYYCPVKRGFSLYCITQSTDSKPVSFKLFTNDPNEPKSKFTCENGFWLIVDEYGNYINPQGQSVAPTMSYNQKVNDCSDPTPQQCTYDYSSTWTFTPNEPDKCKDVNPTIPTTNQFLIKYSKD